MWAASRVVWRSPHQIAPRADERHENHPRLAARACQAGGHRHPRARSPLEAQVVVPLPAKVRLAQQSRRSLEEPHRKLATPKNLTPCRLKKISLCPSSLTLDLNVALSTTTRLLQVSTFPATHNLNHVGRDGNQFILTSRFFRHWWIDQCYATIHLFSVYSPDTF